MKNLTLKQYLFTQPGPREENPTDKIYLELANRLLQIWDGSGLLPEVPDELRQAVVLGIIGYYEDVLCDTGLWRSFTEESLRLHNRRVPFHSPTEEYIPYELNRSDVEFVLWYQLAFNSMQHRFRYPLDKDIVKLADLFLVLLESGYDDAVNPEGYRDFFDLELNDPEYSEKLYTFIHWLYWRSWLMLPPFQLTYAGLYPELVELQQHASSPEDAKEKMEKFQNQIMSAFPTGPLALYLREWLGLIVQGKAPKEKPRRYVAPEGAPEATEHPYYTAFMKATGGKDMAFFATYHELNDFFVNSLGWAKGEEHLPALKGHSDFVLMVTPHSGMMVAKNIARCIASPENPLYDKEHARIHAFNLISQRAVCPGDMLRHILANGWLPDAAFPETPAISGQQRQPSFEERNKAAVENADFLARVYLQEYYRGD